MAHTEAATVAARGTLGVILRVLLPFACGYFLSYLFRRVNAVIAPNLMQAVGLSAADLGLLTSTYFLAFCWFLRPVRTTL